MISFYLLQYLVRSSTFIKSQEFCLTKELYLLLSSLAATPVLVSWYLIFIVTMGAWHKQIQHVLYVCIVLISSMSRYVVLVAVIDTLSQIWVFQSSCWRYMSYVMYIGNWKNLLFNVFMTWNEIQMKISNSMPGSKFPPKNC